MPFFTNLVTAFRGDVTTVEFLNQEGPAALDALEQAVDALAALDPTAAGPFDQELRRLRVAYGDAEQYFESPDPSDQETALLNGGRIVQEAKEQRSQILPLLRNDLTALKNAPGGNALLDEMMASVNWSRPSQSDRALGREVLKARFGLETVTGKLGKKALPKLYELLGMVPDEHIAFNDMFKHLDRSQTRSDFSGLYSQREEKLTIWVQRVSGPLSSSVRFPQDDNVDPTSQMDNVQLPLFDHTTLHEVGHAVDKKLRFMELNGRQDQYGGWRSESRSSIADACIADGLPTRFPDIPVEFLKSYLELELENGDEGAAARASYEATQQESRQRPTPEIILQTRAVARAEEIRGEYLKDGLPSSGVRVMAKKACKELARLDAMRLAKEGPERLFQDTVFAVASAIIELASTPDAIRQVLGAAQAYIDVTPDWDTLAQDKTARLCNHIHAHNVGGLWPAGQAGAEGATLGKRVYSVYAKEGGVAYHSYLLNARKQMVSNYQFNAPSEWFAELYALYYTGLLPESHPARPWLDSEVANSVVQQWRRG
ncbi:MAG: hypothetical protein H6739_07960 [Alphaproteobacteria bacterium]|nr:hypothetical protein [Alphaproteobacteria bacterium]